jgi:hypothetical protein
MELELKDSTLLIRLPSRMIEGIDAGIEVLATDPELRPVTRSGFVRYAIGYCLDQLAATGPEVGEGSVSQTN